MKKVWSVLKKGISKKAFVVFALFLLLPITPSFLLINTRDYLLDNLSYQINNYNSESMLDNGYQPTVLSLEKSEAKNKEKYQTLYRNFYYNPTNGIVRLKSDCDFYCGDNKVTMLSQPTFSIFEDKKASGFYDLDFRLFEVYYCHEIFASRDYLKPRGDCETFVFISDSFAEKLVNKYGLQNKEEPFRELIENYYSLSFQNDNGEIFKASINNIVSTSTRTGPRTKELFDDFALVYELTTSLDKLLSFNFEIELKDNAFCVKKTINDVEALNYSYKDYNYSILKYSPSENKYFIDGLLTEKLNHILLKSWNDFLPTLFLAISFVLPFFLYFVCRYLIKPNHYYMVIFLFLVVFLIFGIVVNFCYIYFYWTLPFVFSSISLLILSRKEVSYVFKCCFGEPFKKHKKEMANIYTIEI